MSTKGLVMGLYEVYYYKQGKLTYFSTACNVGQLRRWTDYLLDNGYPMFWERV
jgi:hypothetical protein